MSAKESSVSQQNLELKKSTGEMEKRSGYNPSPVEDIVKPEPTPDPPIAKPGGGMGQEKLEKLKIAAQVINSVFLRDSNLSVTDSQWASVQKAFDYITKNLCD